MAIREVLKMGAPLLLQKAEPVAEFDTPELNALIADMLETMREHNGAGIAAPQIGESKQLVIFGGVKSPRYPDAELVPFTVLINPVLTPLAEDQADDWEGCLSVPGLRGMVPRYTQLRYQGVDQLGNEIDCTVSGFHARVVQHEVDHLLGILYPMRIKDMTKFGFNEAILPGQNIVDE